jgi:hypothetical protein
MAMHERDGMRVIGKAECGENVGCIGNGNVYVGALVRCRESSLVKFP